jgi:hypothetical protein
MIFAASAFRFAKATNINDIVFTVSAVGDLSFAGTIYSGAISTGGGILASSLTLGSTGDIITVRNITASGTISANSFTEGGVSLASKYLSSATLANYVLKAGDDMTGKLTILNAAGLTTPQLGDYGGIGDRLILWKGNAGAYPYSLGMAGGTMWYSVPVNAIHNFYVNGTSRYQINTTGATLTGDLTVTGSITSGSTNNCFLGGLRINGSDTGNTLYNGTNSIGITALNSVHISTGTSLANYAQRLTVNTSGNVNITNSLSIANMQIFDYLFNNTGNTHASASDYNVSSFGCRFILGTTNQPSVPYGSQNSSYTWYMGLGSEYPASQFVANLLFQEMWGIQL